MDANKIAYLDNNATVLMPRVVRDAMCSHMNKGNPSSDYSTAIECRQLMQDFKQRIASTCGFTLMESLDCYGTKDIFEIYANIKTLPSENNYKIIITSGASESNNFIITSVVDAYTHEINEGNTDDRIIPHIIVSAIEHKSILSCVERLQLYRRIQLTIVAPDRYGIIDPETIRKEIRENTALISVMHANNETGAINDIRKIGEIAHSRNVPFHTDCTQTFGKSPFKPNSLNVDAFSMSFHKTYGPPGIGLLVVRSKFLLQYKLQPIISGPQNNGLRGGTENIFLIAGAHEALDVTFDHRDKKSEHLMMLKKRLISGLVSSGIPCKTIYEYYNAYAHGVKAVPAIEVLVISPATNDFLQNTIMLSLVKHSKTEPKVCNKEIKQRLHARDIVVSIGSSCNTSSPKASHVLYAMGLADIENVRKGVIRVSTADYNTTGDIDRFISAYVDIIKMYNQ